MAGSEYDQSGSNGKRRGGAGVGKEEGGRAAGGKVVTFSRGEFCSWKATQWKWMHRWASCSICLGIVIETMF